MVIVGFIEFLMMIAGTYWLAMKQPSDDFLLAIAKGNNDIADIFEKFHAKEDLS